MNNINKTLDSYSRNRGILLNDKQLNTLCQNITLGDKGIQFPIVKTTSIKDRIGQQEVYLDKDFNNITKDGNNIKIITGKISEGICILGELKPNTKVIGVCEGPETALSIYQALNIPVIVTMGCQNFKNVSHIKWFDQYNTEEVVIFSDKDKSKKGQLAATKLKSSLNESHSDLRVYILTPEIDYVKGAKSVDYNDVYKDSPQKIVDQFELRHLNGFKGKPKPIRNELPRPPRLEHDKLPSKLSELTMDYSKSRGLDESMLLIGILSAVSSLLARNYRVTPYENKDILISPNLYSGVIAGAGSGKTPSINTTLVKPLEVVDITNRELDIKALETIESLDKAIKKFSTKLDKLELDIEICNSDEEKDILKDKRRAISKALERKVKERKEQKVNLHQILVTDTTPEALILRSSRTNKNLCWFRDEMSSLMNDMGTQGKHQLRELLLSGWPGTSSYKKETVGRGTEYVETLSLNLCGTIQPSILNSYLEEIISGKGNDGLFQRIVLIYPDLKDILKPMGKPSEKVKSHYINLLQTLNDMSIIDKTGSYQLINFDSDALQVFERFNDERLFKVKDDKNNEVYREFLSKYDKLFCTLALFFESFNKFNGKELRINTISLESTRMAYFYTNYFEDHLKRILHPIINKETCLSNILAKKYLEGKLKPEQSMRDIRKKGWINLNGVNIYIAIEELEKHNWMRLETIYDPRTNREKEMLVLNPLLDKVPKKGLFRDF